MANTNIKLPIVEPFELTEPDPHFAAEDGLATELEDSLMTDLQELAASFGKHGHVPAHGGTARRFDTPATTDEPPSGASDPRARPSGRRLEALRRPRAKPEERPFDA